MSTDTLIGTDVQEERSVENIFYSLKKEAFMEHEIEKRTFNAELRLAGNKRKIVGYAAKFNSESRDLGGFVETIKPGAFRDSLQRDLEGNPIMAFWNHETSMPLGSTQNGTLKLREDSTGLWFECYPPKTSWSKDVRESISSGLITGCSFGFQIEKDKWRDGGSRRELVKVKLHEISPCSMPAYPETSVDVRIYRRLKMETQKETMQMHARAIIDALDSGDENNDFGYHSKEYDKYAKQLGFPVIARDGIAKFLERANQVEQPIVGPWLEGTDESDTRAYGEGTRSKEHGPFKNLGEQIRAIHSAGVPGGMTDERLYKVRAASGLSEGVSSDGGFLLQDQFANEIFRAAFGDDSIIPRCRKISISTGANGLTLPAVDETSRVDGSRWGGVNSFWTGEAHAYTSSKPKFRQMKMSLHKLTGLCYATDELISDASALAAVIQDAFADELKFKMNDAVLNGTGVGMPQGILQSGALVTASKETAQAASSVVWENILSIWERMPYRNRGNAVWLIHQSVESQLFSMSMTTGTAGVPVFMPAGGASNAPFSTLLGRPLIPVEACAQLGTVGDVVLADLSQYVLIDKNPQYDSSLHVRFEHGEQCFRFQYRVDGQTLWAAPMTPFKGSTTVSPFVTLETRA